LWWKRRQHAYKQNVCAARVVNNCIILNIY
jgi:hypothetical protein